MPLKEYICKDCGKKFEVLTERWDKKCPQCGSEKVERKFSTFAFNFSPKLR